LAVKLSNFARSSLLMVLCVFCMAVRKSASVTSRATTCKMWAQVEPYNSCRCKVSYCMCRMNSIIRGMRSLQRRGHRWEGSIEMDLKKLWEEVDWTRLAQNRDWCAHMNT
jgi:hypothetical protein